MTVTIATLGERALRRLGVTIVAAADRPALTVAISPTALATGALVELGVIVVSGTSPGAAIVPAATLATNALVELGVIAADETPIDADQILALSRVGFVHDALAGQSFVSWTLNTVPAGVAEEYIKLTANIMASSFGKPGDPAIHAALEDRVRKVAMVMQAPARAIAAVASVHDALVAQAVVPWTLNTVPQAVSEEYIKLTANIMASSFGKPGDPAIHAALEARVRKVAVVLGALDIAVGAVMTVHLNLIARGVARWTVFDIPPAVEGPYVLLAANELAPQFGAQANPRDELAAVRSLAQYVALPTSGEQVAGAYF